jgi:2-isopropylmalate synthase
MGEVTVQLEESGQKVVGRGASTDVIEASAKAYIDGLNQLARRGVLAEGVFRSVDTHRKATGLSDRIG